MVLHDLFIARGLVVETRDVDLVSQLVLDSLFPAVERGSGRPGGVFLVEEAAQPAVFLCAVSLPLLGDFVADAPQDEPAMVAVTAHPVLPVPLAPHVLL